jgi:hypothetical protein
MIDVDAIKSRFDMLSPILDERGRRLFAATEAQAAGRGGIMAVYQATGIARSTIGRGLAELRLGADQLEGCVRRPGAGRKTATETQPGLLLALDELVQSSIRRRRCAGSARASAVCPQRWPGKVSPPDRSWSAVCSSAWVSASKPTARPAKAAAIPTAMRSSSPSMPR